MNLHISIGMEKKISLLCLIVVVCGIAICFPIGTAAEESPERFTLQSAIETALEANLDLKISEEEIQAAQSLEKAQRTTFYPKFSASYSYRRNDSEERSLFLGVTQPLNLFALSAQVTQPIFTGFALLNQYKIASLGLDIAKIRETIIRREIIFGAKRYYFLLLKAEKLLNVSEDAVKQLEAHRSVAENFYQVGMTPLNDLLKAEVELANAHQDLVVAQNNLEIAKAKFNTLLRRPINGIVELEDILDFASFEYDIDYCLDMAEENRFEIQVVDLEVEVAEKEIEIQKKDFYPSVNLEGNWYQFGTEWDVDGGEGISNPHTWNVTAVASWNIWEWGRKKYGVKEKLSRLSQAKYQSEKIREDIQLEIKQAFLKTKESETNISTVKKAIEQAKESFRISEERYKEQMATSTDVLDARTLLSKTMTNYYNALYDFKISKAALYRAMGREVME